MKIISHRGNICGRNVYLENHPYYIKQAVDDGFDVEVDVWFVNGEFVLGHDVPQHTVDLSFLKSLPLWCHAKNADALQKLLEEDVHCFWHESDTYTLTSRNVVWCYIGNHHNKGITVFLNEPPSNFEPIFGVCTDYPFAWKERLEK